MSTIRRPRVKVQANLGNKRKAVEEKKPVIIKDEEKDNNTFKCPLSTITPSNTNNNSDIPSNNILQKDLQSSSNLTNGSSSPITAPSPTSSRRRRTSSSSSSTAADDLHQNNQNHQSDLKPLASYKTKSDLHLHIPPRVRTESSSSTHSIRDARIRPDGIGSRIRTESVSSNISESGASKKLKMIRDVSNKDRSELTMFDLIYNFIPTANPMVKSEPGANMKPPPLKTEPNPPLPVTPPTEEESSATPILVPQLKIGLNGEVILDEQSLEIQTTAEKEAKKVLSNSSCIFMDEFTGSNGFYRKQKRTKEWPESETIKFYKCLHTVGTDFSLMMSLFPNRNRRDLKLKFKKEERVNENLIKKALLHPKFFDIKELEKVLASDEEEKRKREEEWNELKKKKASAKKTPRAKKNKQIKNLLENDLAYKNENILSSNINIRNKTKIKEERREVNSSLISDEGISDTFNNNWQIPGSVHDDEETTQSSVMEVDVRDLKTEAQHKVEKDTTPTEAEQPLKDGEELLGEFVPDDEESSIMEVDVNNLKVETPPTEDDDFEIHENVNLKEELSQSVKKENTISEEKLKNSVSDQLSSENSNDSIQENGISEPFEAVKNENLMSFKNDANEFENSNSDDDSVLPDSASSHEEDCVNEKGRLTSPTDEEFEDMTLEEIIASVTNGSLAVVTSESDDGETLYEVYKMCPNSGELSENPLNLHPEIINVIKMVV